MQVHEAAPDDLDELRDARSSGAFGSSEVARAVRRYGMWVKRL